MHVCIGGVSLRPGDGIIHSWLNRMLLPDTLGTGGDSHTRFPIGMIIIMSMLSMMMMMIIMREWSIMMTSVNIIFLSSLGMSFPAGSGLVAFAAATGIMPLDMPESVLVKFSGTMQPGMSMMMIVVVV